MINARSIAAAAATAAAGLVGLVPASAAYVPGPYTGGAPAGAFTQVVACQTFTATGGSTPAGTVTGADNGATLTVTVPAGAFAADTQVCIYRGNYSQLQSYLPAGQTVHDGYAVGWTPSTNAASALTFTIADSGILGGDRSYQTTSGGVAPGGGTVSPGSFTAKFTVDPGFVVAQVNTVPTKAPAAGGGASQPTPFPIPGVLLALAAAILAGAVARTFLRG